MNLSPLPIQKFFSNIGLPLVGGRLFTYIAGTSTKVATYTNAGGTLNTNPIVLNFRGECRLWIDPQQAYKFVLAPPGIDDPPTNPIWTVDDITAAPLAFDNTSNDTGSVNNIALTIPQISSPVAFTRVVFKAANTNTGPTTLQINGGTALPLQWQNTEDFAGGEIQANGLYEAIFDGAQWQLQGPTLLPTQMRTAAEIAAGKTPVNYARFPSPWKDISRYVSDNTGAFDVTTQFNDALGAEKNIIIPEGTYLISGSLQFRDNMHIQGAGYLATSFKSNSGSFSFWRSTYGENPTIGQRPTGICLEGFAIQNSSLLASSIGINYRNAQYCTVRDVLINNVATGVATDQIAQYNVYDRLIVQIATTGVYMESTGGANRFVSCDIGGNTVCMDLHSGAYELEGTSAEATSAATTYIVRVGRPGGANATVHASGLYIEGLNAATIPLQVENSATRCAFRLHPHGTLGAYVNNAGDQCIIEVPGQGVFNPIYKQQLLQFSNAIGGAVQSHLRSNGGNTLEVRNSTNSGYGDAYSLGLKLQGAPTGVTGFVSFGNLTQTTVGAAGGASALPATPTGYLRFFVNTTEFVIPYYARV